VTGTVKRTFVGQGGDGTFPKYTDRLPSVYVRPPVHARHCEAGVNDALNVMHMHIGGQVARYRPAASPSVDRIATQRYEAYTRP